MQQKKKRSLEWFAAGAGSGAGVEMSEASRWRESHRTRRSDKIVTVDES